MSRAAKYYARERDLVGRTITAVEFRPFQDGRGGMAHDPVLTLDNGDRLVFMTEETDVARHGTRILLVRPGKKEEETNDL